MEIKIKWVAHRDIHWMYVGDHCMAKVFKPNGGHWHYKFEKFIDAFQSPEKDLYATKNSAEEYFYKWYNSFKTKAV